MLDICVGVRLFCFIYLVNTYEIKNILMDMEKIATGVATQLTKDTVKSFFGFFPKKIASKYDLYFRNFEDYLERTHRTCCFVKTIISKDKPTAIDSIYVKTTFRCLKERIGDDELIQRVRDRQRVVVSGFGGIGKTIFCKYLWKTVYDNPNGRLPIYFELRNINDITTQSLVNFIRLSLTAVDRPVSEADFHEMMQSGRFVFIFDGFDEIPDRFRLDIQSQILSMAQLYSDCCFVVSSRADDRFGSWLEFHTYNAVEFNKEQSKEVIQKIDFDKDVKKEFILEILEKRYEDYKTLFSTPLLTLMMLMTYLQIKYVPDSRHVFFRYAFQTLYTLHDASKQGFQRRRFVEMGESDFIHVFALFCLISYADGEHSFEKTQIIEYFEKVKKRVKINYDSEMFLKECVESVNLIYKDGDQYSFLHRSFQEYFCAYAVTHYYPDKITEVIERLPTSRSDSVFSMMYSINPDVISRMYILPKFNTIQKTLLDISRLMDPLEIISAFQAKLVVVFSLDVKSSYFGFRLDFERQEYHFIETILCTFKKDMPDEISRKYSGHGDVGGLAALLRPVVRSKYPKTNNSRKHCVAELDFEKRSIEFYSGPYGSKSAEHLLNCKFSDIPRLDSKTRYFNSLAASLKAELVFSKKKCEEIVRSVRDVNRSGDDILSL